MDARFPLRRIRGLFSSFDSGFVLMSRAYRRKRKSSRGLLLILSEFCASYTASPRPGLFSLPPRRMSNVGYGSRLNQPAIFVWRNTNFSAEDLSEMAWASVTNIESYLDCAPVGLFYVPFGEFRIL